VGWFAPAEQMFYTLGEIMGEVAAIAIVVLLAFAFLVVLLWVFAIVLAMFMDLASTVFAPLQAQLWKMWSRLKGKD
jgi:uncharacterized membrane protein